MGITRQDRHITAKTFRFFLHHASGLCVAFIRVTFVVWTLFALGTPAYAATCQWSGKGDNNRWSTKGNWVNCGNGSPKANDTVEFLPGALRPASENDISPLSLASITINGIGENNARFDISGLGIAVTVLIRVEAPPDAAGLSPIIRNAIV